MIQHAVDRVGRGSLELVASGRARTLQEAVRRAVFRRDGARLSVILEFGGASAATASATRDVVLRVP